MTQYCYVRTHADGTGTRATTTAYTSIQTGDWDTTLSAVGDYYASISSAISNNTLVAGDFIICSSIHNIDYGANTTITIPDGVIIMSVDDTAIDDELAGAVETTESGVYDLFIGNTTAGASFHREMEYRSGDLLEIGSAVESVFDMKGGALKLTGSSAADGVLSGNADGAYIKLRDVDLQCPDNGSLSNGGFALYSGVIWDIKGGSLLYNTIKPNKVFYSAGVDGGTLLIDGFDATNLASGGGLVDIDSSADDNNLVIAKNVLLGTGGLLSLSTLGKPGQRIEGYSIGTGDEYFEIEIRDYYGSVTTETSIVRTNSKTYDGTNQISLAVTPITGNCVNGVSGLVFNLPGAVYADLSSATTVTIYGCINNTSTAATQLTHFDVKARITRPDGTNQALGIVQDSIDETGVETSILKTATNLTSSAEGWDNDHANAKQFEITVDIGALTGVTDGRVTVEMEVMPTSLDVGDQIYICPDFDVS